MSEVQPRNAMEVYRTHPTLSTLQESHDALNGELMDFRTSMYQQIDGGVAIDLDTVKSQVNGFVNNYSTHVQTAKDILLDAEGNPKRIVAEGEEDLDERFITTAYAHFVNVPASGLQGVLSMVSRKATASKPELARFLSEQGDAIVQSSRTHRAFMKEPQFDKSDSDES